MTRTRTMTKAVLAAGVAAVASMAFMPAAWSHDPFGGRDFEATQQQLNSLGGGLQLLAEDPHTLLTLQQAYERGSFDDFRAGLKDVGLELPADQCDPYVTVYVTAISKDWTVGTTTVLEVQKFVRGVCPAGTYGPPQPPQP